MGNTTWILACSIGVLFVVIPVSAAFISRARRRYIERAKRTAELELPEVLRTESGDFRHEL